MPYKSDTQRRWAHTETGTKALGGKKAVHEWDTATKGKDIPEKVGKTENLDKSLPNPKSSKDNYNTVGSQMNSAYFNKSTKNVALKGKQSVTAKTPKLKAAPDPFTFKSKFFEKSESEPKHKNLKKLWDFIQKKYKKQ
jgi:hypothetical protein